MQIHTCKVITGDFLWFLIIYEKMATGRVHVDIICTCIYTYTFTLSVRCKIFTFICHSLYFNDRVLKETVQRDFLYTFLFINKLHTVHTLHLNLRWMRWIRKMHSRIARKVRFQSLRW
jgi:hypothetical protein